MKDSLVLALDFGTQSLRVSLVDKKGQIVAIEKNRYAEPYFSSKKGYAEQNADFYWNNAVETLKVFCANNQDRLPRIIGATVTTFRDTAVQLDKDFKPLRPCILWLDQRLADVKEKINPLYMALFTIVGKKDTIVLNRRRTMAHWIKENEPELWKKVYKYVNLSTYINFKLTNRLADSVSGMTGHYPVDMKNRKWHDTKSMMGCIFGIKKEMLCELVESGSIIGTVSDNIADLVGLPRGIKLYASGADKGCETVGVGALSNDIAAISYGTACTIEVSNQKYHEPEPFLPAYSAVIPNWYNMEVQIYRGYWMLKWFCKEFAGELIDEAKLHKMAVEELMDEGLEKVPAGCDGLVLQPYWGPGLARPLAKGAMIGFSDVITRNHFYRAIIEGIAYALREGLESIQKSQRHKIKEIRISGGGSNSEAVCQITADVFNLPVKRIQTDESTSLGAAVATFVAAGEFNSIDDAINNMVHIVKTYVPNPANAVIYDHLFYNVYLKMYPKLNGIYKSIKKITQVK